MKIARTVISLRVSVPVLSEQITVAAPSVSTAGSLRTMALAAAMRRTPRLKPNGDDGRQRLGDRRDRERHGEQEQAENRVQVQHRSC